LITPLLAIGQTRVPMSKNKYSVQQDVELGRRAAAEIEQQMPILNDYEATRYVQEVGRRLVNAIPSEFRQPGFQYSFKVVNARDINAFALPGGPMYVNRGMIEAARNEGEMAGVMAHELAHVALRHGTAQATKAANPKAQLPAIGGAILGAILGGQAGGAIAQAGQIGSAAIVTKYSREYETQADILGAQIMANAGYDPRDLANMFRTIEQQSGGSRAPQWLSSHPNPGNRYANIEREARLLRVSGNPIGRTAQFERVQSRLRGMSPARTMQEIAQNGQRYPQQGGGQGQSPIAGGRYSRRVQLPSARSQVFSSGGIQMSVPSNWRQFSPGQSEVWFAPDGAYGDQGITHGALIGFSQARSNNLDQATEGYVNGILQSNNHLRQTSNYSRVNFAGRQGYATVLSGRSPVTNQNEVTTVYTTQLRNGNLFYVVTVAPQNEAAGYNNAFRRMLGSLRIND
ncbi:MAG: M48 family metallopeptidase, partial [Acidobacteriota bacterium]|nr:M48 family metallopeptidase [Acidobacteriota bacterium]